MKKQWFVLFGVVLVASFFTSLAFAERVDSLRANSNSVIDNSRIPLIFEEDKACRAGEVVVCKYGKLQTVKKQTKGHLSGMMILLIVITCCTVVLNSWCQYYSRFCKS